MKWNLSENNEPRIGVGQFVLVAAETYRGANLYFLEYIGDGKWVRQHEEEYLNGCWAHQGGDWWMYVVDIELPPRLEKYADLMDKKKQRRKTLGLE